MLANLLLLLCTHQTVPSWCLEISPSALLGEGLLWGAFFSIAVAGFAPRCTICVFAHGAVSCSGSPEKICVCQAVKLLVLVFSVLSDETLTWTHGPACGFIPTREFSPGSLFPFSSCFFFPLVPGTHWCGRLPSLQPPVLWLTLNATYQRRNLLLLFHLASSAFIASIWAKGYFPLYRGEVITCSCVSSHCSRAMPSLISP